MKRDSEEKMAISYMAATLLTTCTVRAKKNYPEAIELSVNLAYQIWDRVEKEQAKRMSKRWEDSAIKNREDAAFDQVEGLKHAHNPNSR